MARPDEFARFAVGNPELAISAVWNIWISGNEVYVAPRSSAGKLKLSLHSSGIWRLAATRQSGIVFEENRKALAWTRPPEFRPGWTEGLTIIVPHRRIQEPLTGLIPPVGKQVIWIPGPRPEEKVAIFIMLANADEDAVSAFDSRHRIYGDGHLLPKGERVWLISRADPLLEAEAAYVESLVEGLRVHTGPGAGKTRSLNVFSVGGDHHPVITDIALGGENVVSAKLP